MDCVRHFPVAPATQETIRLSVSGSREAPGKTVIPAAKGRAGIAFGLLILPFIAAVTIPCMSLIA